MDMSTTLSTMLTVVINVTMKLFIDLLIKFKYAETAVKARDY
jgi:hypothetical protein